MCGYVCAFVCACDDVPTVTFVTRNAGHQQNDVVSSQGILSSELQQSLTSLTETVYFCPLHAAVSCPDRCFVDHPLLFAKMFWYLVMRHPHPLSSGVAPSWIHSGIFVVLHDCTNTGCGYSV